MNKFQNCKILVEDAFDKTRSPEEYTYESFFKTIKENKIKVEEIGRIVIQPNGDNTDSAICGIAPMWKQHDSKELFEYYFTNSEMMRELYANEREADGEPAEIYIEVGTEGNTERYVVTWKSTSTKDIFTYRSPTPEECGILDLLWQKGGYMEKDECKLIPMGIRIVIEDDSITIRQCKDINTHASTLGFDPSVILIR